MKKWLLNLKIKKKLFFMMFASLISMFLIGYASYYFFNSSRLIYIILNGERVQNVHFHTGIQNFYKYLNTKDANDLNTAYKQLDAANNYAEIFSKQKELIKKNSKEKYVDILFKSYSEVFNNNRNNAELMANRIKILLWLNNPQLNKAMLIAKKSLSNGLKVKKTIENYIKTPNKEALSTIAKANNKMFAAEDEFAQGINKIKDIIFRHLLIGLIIVIILLGTFFYFISSFISNNISKDILQILNNVKKISKGDFNTSIAITSQDEIGEISSSINKMTISLKNAAAKNEKQDWLKTGQNKLNEKMRGDLDLVSLSRNIITYLAKYLNALIGAIYIIDEEDETLKLTATYAFTKRKSLNNKIKIGEGLVGQAAFEKQMISVTNMPDDYFRISSGLGDTKPRNIIVNPFALEDKLIGVVELGSIKEFSDQQMEFLNSIMESIAIGINSALSRNKMKTLLEKTQQQAEELQTQQEELRTSNEELEQQTEALKKSEQELQAQQEELRVTNEELEEKTHSLELQKKNITEKNIELESARKNIEQKAKELEISGKYKSEFLANMSHELRTPLNSMLILSRDLADNKQKNLTKDQLESAEIVYKSGNDLLTLINNILDLSKIEAGKMNFNINDVKLLDIANDIKMYFTSAMREKNLKLNIKLNDNLPSSIKTDQQRVEQIIKNLMSNAIKFTQQGSITVDFHKPTIDVDLSRSKLDYKKSIAISVIDTGIGIPKNKQLAIFEAFQQADGSTSRKYGGTGLGLSISRELSKFLCGEIQLQSEVGKGSVFTLYLPFETNIKSGEIKREVFANTSSLNNEIENNTHLKIEKSDKETQQQMIDDVQSIPDDRDKLKEDDKIILVIEDDPNFAKILMRQCHEKNFKCIASATGEEGLKLAEQYVPQAIILDIMLPGIDGWTVLENLKSNPKIRHIPVHMMSVLEETIDAYKKGAIGYLTKPVKKEDLDDAFDKIENFNKRKVKELLIVEDDKNTRKSIKVLIGGSDVRITEAETGKDAVKKIKSQKFDCIVLDLGLPDMAGEDLLEKLKKDKNIELPPVIVYTGKELTKIENDNLMRFTDSIIIKGVKSEERLLDETALFLHRVVSDMPEQKQKIISNLYNKDLIFENKKILIVDDDMRNVFALTKVLEERGMNVLKAENGKMALDIVNKENDIDLILMDIMMPVMDGYETIRKIREQNKFIDLPIIALTAKAMKQDREKCISAGANDYLSKPIVVEKLLSLMRVWLYK